MRLKLEETPVYKEHEKQRDEQEQQGFWRVFAQHWRAVLICIGLVLVFNVTDAMSRVGSWRGGRDSVSSFPPSNRV